MTHNITIPIDEYDIELFKQILHTGEPIQWTFPADTGDDVEITFVLDTDKD